MLIRFFLLTFALSLLAFGQNKDDRRHVRLIPLGERPVNPPVLIDNVLVRPEPSPGQLPPNPVSITTSKGGSLALPLKLMTISNFASLEPEVGNFEMWAGEAPKGAPLLKGPAPRAQMSLAVLYRDHAKMSWLAPKIYVLKDDPKTFPLEHIRFVNVSEFIISVEPQGGKPFGIAPLNSKVIPVVVGRNGQDRKYKIGTMKKGQRLTDAINIHENTIAHEKGQRTTCFFYKPQDKKANKAALMTTVGEKIPALPKPPKKDKKEVARK